LIGRLALSAAAKASSNRLIRDLRLLSIQRHRGDRSTRLILVATIKGRSTRFGERCLVRGGLC